MTDNTETIEGLTVGQVITAGTAYCIGIDENLSSRASTDQYLKPDDELTILGFEQTALVEGYDAAAVVRLHRPGGDSSFSERARSGTVFLLPLKFLHKWVAREALAKKYAEEDKR